MTATPSAGLPVVRISAITIDGGTMTTSVNGGEEDAHKRFEHMRDSGDYLAVFIMARGGGGHRIDDPRAIRAWARPATAEPGSEWQEGIGVLEA